MATSRYPALHVTKRQPLQWLKTPFTAQSCFGMALLLTMMEKTSSLQKKQLLPVSRSVRTKEQMWTFDVDHVTWNNRRKHAQRWKQIYVRTTIVPSYVIYVKRPHTFLRKMSTSLVKIVFFQCTNHPPVGA